MTTSVQPCECGQIVPEGERHCWFHHVAEHSKSAYIMCFECGHVWTKRALRKAYRRGVTHRSQWEQRPWFRSNDFAPSWARVLWKAATIRAKNIYFCQLCIHDF
jgi:hypothetical protein